MPPPDAISVDGEGGDWDHDVESSLDAGTSRRRQYNYQKCATCRERKKKCEPADRVWPDRCQRCIALNLSCSRPEDIRERSTTGLSSRTLSPNTDHARIRKPTRPKSVVSASLTRSPDIEESVPVLTSPTRQQPQPPQPSLPNLCGSCQRLGLSRSRFIVPSRSWKGPLGKATSRFTSPGTSGDAMALNQRIDLGTLADIKQSAFAKPNECSFCYLVWQSAQDQLILAGRTEPDPPDVSVHATWEIDGRELVHFDKETCFFQPVTRHVRLSFVEPSTWLKDSYVLLRGDDLKLPGFDPSFLGREVQPAPRPLERIAATTKAWLDDCSHRHAHCNPMAVSHLSEDSHLRVIDIKDNKLVPFEDSMDYVVLSYTWNEPEEVFLTMDRKDDWYAGGFSEIRDQLPQTTRDAMKLIQELGIRYLWVDSLCILHDPGNSLEDKQAKCEQMKDKRANYSAIDDILASAFLTICAVTGPTSTSIPQHIRSCGERMSLMVHHPVETHIQSSQWSKGAWTCQDRMLSGRCLILTSSAVWFQCQEESMSEDTFEPSFQGRSADWVQSPAQIWSELAQQNSQFRAYIKCVESYTSRQLPSEDHALKAFSGISNFLRSSMKTRFFSGLPNSYFDAAILWTPSTGESYLRYHQGQPVAPSWSWAGWTGQAIYRPPMLTGAVESIPDWLREHTWISWYLVDRSSNIIGEVGTFARTDVSSVADGLERPTKETDRPFSPTPRPPYKDNKERWPSRKRREFTKRVPSQPDSMEIDTGTAAPPSTPFYYLQFWTWSAFLRLSARPNAVDTRTRWYNILDRNDDVCGSIVLPGEFADGVDKEPNGQPFQFVATADARIFFEKEEMPEWTYYIPKERHDSSWDLWYVMLIETDKDDISRRRGPLSQVVRFPFGNFTINDIRFFENCALTAKFAVRVTNYDAPLDDKPFQDPAEFPYAELIALLRAVDPHPFNYATRGEIVDWADSSNLTAISVLAMNTARWETSER
ncbi:hypothetical protein B0T16DRAFT_447003 [Cercophora newfieldiana]|uniref:Zn(2)-C6 fungal-type domain-containing protein n=1 Tax=Cercophora newfieldiana TaxID=92897 RepID=A0AA39XZ34_9PEZI|nr:hypothetical protein B0T16DRAFT_447003 [Cercophora newfieldiana]